MHETAQVEVSVIVAVKNGAHTLQRCIDSVMAQRGVELELVVVDGGSTDGTTAILQANEAHFSYRVSEPDSGIYGGWNKALRQVRGAWVCFLGCDDVFHDEFALRDLVRCPAAASGAATVIYGKMNLVTASGVVAQTVGQPWAQARRDFLAGFMIPHPGTLHDRRLFARHGAFDESYRIAGDYEFLLRELKDRGAQFVDRVVTDMRLGGASARPETIHVALREVVRARRAHGVNGSPMRLRVALAASRVGAAVYGMLGQRAFGVLADVYRVVRGRPRIWTL